MIKMEEYKIYTYIALIFGLLIAFITPPFQSPDEDSHFKKAYQVSKGNLFSTVKNKKYGNYFPKQMLSYIEEMDKYMGDRDKKYPYSHMVLDQYLKMDHDNKKFNNYPTANVFPLTYTAPAIGILFSKICARIFDMELVTTAHMLYFARVFSLIVTVLITAYAIKITPIFKKTFTTVALIPMLVFLNSMVSYDNILNASILLALAIILKITYEPASKQVTKKDISILTLIGILLLNVKTVYFIIFLLMFTIPAKKFKDKKGMLKTAIIMIAIIFGVTILFKIPSLIQTTTSSSAASKQINFILGHPIKYATILWDNIINQRFFQLISMIGLFGLIDTYSPLAVIFLAYIDLIAIALSEGSFDKLKIKKSIKIVVLIYVIFSIIGIYTGMYVSWTPKVLNNEIGGSSISGVQGRYFLPLVMPALILFSNNLIKDKKIFKVIRDNYVLVPIAILTVSSAMIILRYWV